MNKPGTFLKSPADTLKKTAMFNERNDEERSLFGGHLGTSLSQVNLFAPGSQDGDRFVGMESI